GARKTKTHGVSGGHPDSIFAGLWPRLANRYKNSSKAMFGLMNEPVGSSMTATTWLATAQAAIHALQATGATNLILVPSTYWMHPKDWLHNDNSAVMANVTDPQNNWCYDVHQYLDYDGSGSHTDYLSPTDAVATLSGFTEWCRQRNRTAF